MIKSRSNLFVARAGFAALLEEELADTYGVKGERIGDDAIAFKESVGLPHYATTVFARQHLPAAMPIDTLDLKAAVAAIFRRIEIASSRANRVGGRWTMHAFALEDNAANVLAGALEKDVMTQVRSHLGRLAKRYVAPDELVKEALAPADFVVQIYVPDVSRAWLSISSFSAGISPYVGGNLRMRARKGSPSRSARKLEEALHVLGRVPQAGETAVDLGAAPGGWTWTLARRGVEVTAIDALELKLPEGKSLNARVTHRKDNGLKFVPPAPVDWLVCDMIVASSESLKVLVRWLESGAMKHFVVNLKLPKSEPWVAIKTARTLLAGKNLPVFKARHLFHDRREITLVGSTCPLPVAAPRTPLTPAVPPWSSLLGTIEMSCLTKEMTSTSSSSCPLRRGTSGGSSRGGWPALRRHVKG